MLRPWRDRSTLRARPGPARRRADGRGDQHRIGDPRLPEPRGARPAEASHPRSGVRAIRGRPPPVLGPLGAGLGANATRGAQRRPPRPRGPRAVGGRGPRRHAERRSPAPQGRKPARHRAARGARGGRMPRVRRPRGARRRSRSEFSCSTRRGLPATCRPLPTATPISRRIASSASSCPPAWYAEACSSRAWSSSATTFRGPWSTRPSARRTRPISCSSWDSSLAVFSGYRFLRRAVERQTPVVIVNRGPVRGEEHAALKVEANIGTVLDALSERVP